MAMIKVANFCSIGEENSVTKPVEAICQDDLAFGAFWGIVDSGLGNHFVANSQIDLTLVRVGKCVGLPKRHVSIIAGK
jgi:hypothetical protein